MLVGDETAGHTTRPRAPSLFTLIVISSLSPLGINIVVPSMPALERAFVASYDSVQLTLSLYLAAIAVAQLVIGPLSDRFGRRPVLLVGLAVFVLASGLAPFSPNIVILVLIRILQAAGGCAGIVLGRAIIRDLYRRDQAASMIGYVTTGLALAPMLGVVLGGFLQEAYGWRASFWLLLTLGAVALAIAWADLSETNGRPSDSVALGGMMRDFKRLTVEPTFVLYTVISSLTSGIFFAFLGGAPLVAEIMLGMSPSQYGTYFAMVAGGYAIGNLISGRFTSRFGLNRMILAGATMAAATTLTMLVLFGFGLAAPLALFGPMFFGGIANGLVLPSTTAGAISVRPDIAGAAAGLLGAMQIGSGAVLAALTGVLLAHSAGAVPMILVMSLAAALALLLSVLVLPRYPLPHRP